MTIEDEIGYENLTEISIFANVEDVVPKTMYLESWLANTIHPNDADLKEKDICKTKAEETRILYVAMTRAINNLICIVHPPKDSERWAYLIEEVGVDAE